MLTLVASSVVVSEAPRSLMIKVMIPPIHSGAKSNQNLISILFRICFFEKEMFFVVIIFRLRSPCLRHGLHTLFLENSKTIRKIMLLQNNAIIALVQ